MLDGRRFFCFAGIYTASILVNGERVVSTRSGVVPATGPGDLVFGSAGFKGQMFDMRVWKTAQSDETIKGEFSQNGVDNPLSHQRGVISMARSMDPDSASSQFFICYADCSFLDGQYAAFGKVIEGMEVVNKIAECDTNPFNDRPLKPQVMQTVTVDTFGVDYPEPEKM